MRELARVVAPGGRIASLEFGVPGREPSRALWSVYTRFALPGLGRLISPEWAEVGRFLARSIPSFYAAHPLATLPELWREAGIRDVSVRRMTFGAAVVMSGTRDGGPGAAG